MDFAKTFAPMTMILAFTTFGLAGCGGGVEGTYKLDKAEVKKSMEAEIAKMPAADQGMAKFGLAMIEAMDMTIDIQAGGKLKAKSSIALEPGKPAKTEEKDGTWKQAGESITLDTGDGKPLTCTKSGSKLNCVSPTKKAGDPTLVFVKG